MKDVIGTNTMPFAGPVIWREPGSRPLWGLFFLCNKL